MDNTGRPAFDDAWYRKRLDEMEPILKLGNSIGYAAEKTGNGQHRTTLYEKYKLKDWFSDKVNALQAIPGEIANNIAIKLLNKINEKITNDLPITREDIEILKFVAEKHRSSQQFFVTRHEVAKVGSDELEETLDRLDREVETQREEDFIEEMQAEMKKEEEKRRAGIEEIKMMSDEELTKRLEQTEANGTNAVN